MTRYLLTALLLFGLLSCDRIAPVRTAVVRWNGEGNTSVPATGHVRKGRNGCRRHRAPVENRSLSAVPR